jgi:phenylacetate-CoA ligase
MFRDLVELQRLLHNVKLSPEELNQLQNLKLRAVIRHAYENVPYYHSLFESAGLSPEDIRSTEDLKNIPLTAKEDLLSAGLERITAKGVSLSSCHRINTSGTTGKPFTVYFTPDEARIQRLLHFRSLLSIGFQPRDRLSVLGAERFHQTRFHQRFGFYRSENISPSLPIEDQTRQLQRMRPTLLWAYPTPLRALLHHIGYRLSKIISPRILITSAEVFDEVLKEGIKSDLNVEMFNFYGAIEAGRIASECPAHKGLHVNADHLIVECLSDRQRPTFGKPGVVVVTCLNSFAMPFIRYCLGDMSTLVEKRCSCGSSFPLIGPIQGRDLDMIELPSARLLSPLGLQSILKAISGIDQFRFIQENPENLMLQLVFHEPPKEEQLLEIKHRLLEYLGEPVRINFEIVNFIQEDALKFKTFVNLNKNGH